MTRNMELSDRDSVRTTKRAKAKRRRKVERWTLGWRKNRGLVIEFDSVAVSKPSIVAALNRAGVVLPRGR